MEFFDIFPDKSVKMESEAENNINIQKEKNERGIRRNQKHFALVNSIENPSEAQPL